MRPRMVLGSRRLFIYTKVRSPTDIRIGRSTVLGNEKDQMANWEAKIISISARARAKP